MTILGIAQGWWSVAGLALDLLGVAFVFGDWIRDRIARSAARRLPAASSDIETVDRQLAASKVVGPEATSAVASVLLRHLGLELTREQIATKIAADPSIKGKIEAEIDPLAPMLMAEYARIQDSSAKLEQEASSLNSLIKALQAKADPETTERTRVRFIVIGAALISIGFTLQIVGAWPS